MRYLSRRHFNIERTWCKCIKWVIFYIKVRETGGKIQKYIIEVKPKKQCVEPKKKKERTPAYIREVTEYAKNQAKWSAAKEYCKDHLLQFKILTEDNLGVWVGFNQL